MPTYQYACTQCGHRLEAVQSFTDAPLSICTECEGKLRKVFSSVGVVFKGSGFYLTDSRAPAKEAAGSNGTPSPKAGEVAAGSATKPPNGTPAPSGGSSSSTPGTAAKATA